MKDINYYLNLLCKKDFNTYMHSLRVCYYAIQIGSNLNLSKEQIEKLERASLLHDIGKLYISTNILRKREPLTDNEFRVVKKHVEYAKEILGEEYNDIINDIISHHERLNGTGYPCQLKNISLNSQIIAIADSFDAMTTNRGYNKVLSYNDAFLELFKCCKIGMYNESLVKSFYEIFNSQFYNKKVKIKHY